MQRTLSWFLVLTFFFAGTAFASAGANEQATEIRYAVLIAGNKAGFETSKRNSDGTLQLYYEFNDRGRGPNITERILLDARGIPIQIQNSGNDYEKGPVDEQFALKRGSATWKNRAEEGSARVAGTAFYTSISGVPEETALLARALLTAGGRLSLLPAGEAAIETRRLLKVEANGKSRTVIQCAISGLDFTPTPIWLDEDGAFFAAVSVFFSVVREGWEPAIDALTAAQNKVANQRAAGLARSLAHKPLDSLAFVHANVFDSESGSVRPNATVLITGNKIIAVGDDGKVGVPPKTQIIDASHKTVLPGLWDMHVHLSPNDGLLNLAAGVTSVRDLGNDVDSLVATQRRFDEGSEIGPRVLKAGFLDGRGPFQGPTKVFADSEQEAQSQIDHYVQLGYVQIKIYSSIKPELVPKIARMAHDRGMRVSGHVPAFMTAQQFVEDGVDEIQHMNFIFLNFMFGRVKDTRDRSRFTEVAAHATEIDPAAPQVREFINLLKQHGTVLDPTLNVFEGLFTDRPGQISNIYAAIANRLPAQIRRQFSYGGIEVPTGMDQRYRDSFQQMLKMTKAMYDAGVPLVAGTDALAGFTLHRELELYAQAGIPAVKVLQLDTLGAARVMKRDGELGAIVPGKLADLILVDGDPAMNISDIRHVTMTLKDGVIYQNSELCEALGIRPN